LKFTASVKRKVAIDDHVGEFSVSVSVKELLSQKQADQILTDLLAALRQEVLNE
jgi:hypothetical protein